jgi:hypothetical protein
VSFPGEGVSPAISLVRLAGTGLCLVFSNIRFGDISYWALVHPPGKADFHHADSFAVEFSKA